MKSERTSSVPDPESLYRAEADFVWTSLRRLGVGESDLADLTHDVFETAFARLPSFDHSLPLRPWLFGIAVKVAGHHRRWWRRRRENLGEVPEQGDPGKPQDQLLAEQQRSRLVERALLAVRVERRAILLLHEFEGRPMPEIAKALDVPLNTAYSRLRLGRTDLIAAVRRLEAST